MTGWERSERGGERRSLATRPTLAAVIGNAEMTRVLFLMLTDVDILNTQLWQQQATPTASYRPIAVLQPPPAWRVPRLPTVSQTPSLSFLRPCLYSEHPTPANPTAGRSFPPPCTDAPDALFLTKPPAAISGVAAAIFTSPRRVTCPRRAANPQRNAPPLLTYFSLSPSEGTQTLQRVTSDLSHRLTGQPERGARGQQGQRRLGPSSHQLQDKPAKSISLYRRGEPAISHCYD